ncbi:MAG: MBL fold metallo-hydrolase [Chloroflexota bacterium]
MAGVTSLGDGLHCIDLEFQGDAGVIAAYLLESGNEHALIEIGPASTLDTLLRGLDHVNVDPASISKILVTHVHLDHAGAAGTFIRRFPQAHLYVHPLGAPHMIDPERLLRSARRIYGARMDQLWGAFEAIPPDRVHVLNDNDSVRVGSVSLEAVYTPGHASHHIAYYDGRRGGIFAGDVAAVRLQGHAYVRPPTPPPDIDLTLWQRSIERLLSLNPRVLYLTHFGPFSDAGAHLSQVPQRLNAWRDLLRRSMSAGHDREQLIEDLSRFGDTEIAESAATADPQLIGRYELATPYFMSVDGFLRYFQKLERTSE